MIEKHLSKHSLPTFHKQPSIPKRPLQHTIPASQRYRLFSQWHGAEQAKECDGESPQYVLRHGELHAPLVLLQQGQRRNDPHKSCCIALSATRPANEVDYCDDIPPARGMVETATAVVWMMTFSSGVSGVVNPGTCNFSPNRQTPNPKRALYDEKEAQVRNWALSSVRQQG